MALRLQLARAHDGPEVTVGSSPPGDGLVAGAQASHDLTLAWRKRAAQVGRDAPTQVESAARPAAKEVFGDRFHVALLHRAVYQPV